MAHLVLLWVLGATGDAVYNDITCSTVTCGGTDILGTMDAQTPRVGFEDAENSTLSWDDGTRTLTVTPSPSYTIWHGRTPTTISSVKTKQITDTYGYHTVYFDSTGTLQEQTTWDNSLFSEKVLVAKIWWGSVNSKRLIVHDSRHGTTIPPITHQYLYETQGVVWSSGGALTNIVANGAGNSNTHATFGVEDVIIWHIDLKFDSSDFAQTLTNPAQIPVYYFSGALAYKFATVNDYPVADAAKVGSGTRLHYSAYSGGTYTLTEVTSNNYVLAHIIADPSIDEGIIFALIGVNQYATVAAARAGALVELVQLIASVQDEVEAVGIATVIYQTKDVYTNTPKARIVTTDTGDNYVDWRGSLLQAR